jgi:hypothetical protein
MSIVLQGSTSGSVTLQEPAVAGTTVLTLPAVSGNVLTDTSPKAGNVLQVVNATTNGTVSTTGTTYVTTGFSASITPTSSSNKILVMMRIPIAVVIANGEAVKLQVWRGGSSIFTISPYAMFIQGSTISQNNAYTCVDYLDSPATTSSTSYTIYFASVNSVGTIYFCGNSNPATMTLMEIAG